MMKTDCTIQHSVSYDQTKISSSKQTLASLAVCEGNPPVTGAFLQQTTSNTKRSHIYYSTLVHRRFGKNKNKIQIPIKKFAQSQWELAKTSTNRNVDNKNDDEPKQ